MGEGKRRDQAGRPGRRRPVAESWTTFLLMVVPTNASDIQRGEMRRAYYAGAEAVLQIMMKQLDHTTDPDEITDNDMRLMEDVHEDIVQFAEDVKEGKV